VVTGAVQGQFVGIDVFENLEVLVIFGQHNTVDILFIVFLVGERNINFVEGECELFDLSVMIICIMDNMSESGSRYGAYFIPEFHRNTFNGGGSNPFTVRETIWGRELHIHFGKIDIYVMFL
jgi:hypothetical protein